MDIVGNILDITEGYIFHQVNCRGVMGAGLAKQIRTKWPQVYTDYIEFLDTCPNPMGQFCITEVDTVHVVSVFGQLNYGRGVKHTNYSAVLNALASASRVIPEDAFCYFPYKMGCGLAGGYWPEYHRIIKQVFADAIIVYLKEPL
jgi:O-acetyl-ADP-ribose deacetylase (regulator of RNase III)